MKDKKIERLTDEQAKDLQKCLTYLHLYEYSKVQLKEMKRELKKKAQTKGKK